MEAHSPIWGMRFFMQSSLFRIIFCLLDFLICAEYKTGQSCF